MFICIQLLLLIQTHQWLKKDIIIINSETIINE